MQVLREHSQMVLQVKIKLLKELEQILNETNKVDEVEKNFVKKLSL